MNLKDLREHILTCEKIEDKETREKRINEIFDKLEEDGYMLEILVNWLYIKDFVTTPSDETKTHKWPSIVEYAEIYNYHTYSDIMNHDGNIKVML